MGAVLPIYGKERNMLYSKWSTASSNSIPSSIIISSIMILSEYITRPSSLIPNTAFL